jgi:HEAT repeat protein
MPERRRASRRVAAIVGGAVVITALVFGCKFVFFGTRHLGPGPSGGAKFDEKSPLAVVNEGVRNSDPIALSIIQKRVTPKPDEPPMALSDGDASEWLQTLSALRAGFLKYDAPARAMAVNAACRILDKFAVEPAPAQWIKAIGPIHDLLSASLTDSDQNPRYTALAELGRFWVWIPGRPLIPVEEQALAEWKGKFLPLVVRCLAYDDAPTRMAAVACLGVLPIDNAAAPAIPYLENDPSPEVRKQTLVSFAHRNMLLTDEMLLRRLHDDDLSIRETASLVLKTRGLSKEQISLGGLIFSPKPGQRVSVIPLLKNRTDLDPILWLIQLSRDPVETVRISAIEALANYKTPAVQRRLAEMARSDRSEAVRKEAGKFVPTVDETTASLPPLPGSSSLNPKAN